MKCKKCKRTIEDNSIYCNWCGYKQIADRTELRVPKPTRKEDGTWTARIMVAGERVRVNGNSEDEYYQKAKATKAGLLEMKKAAPRITLGAAVDNYINDNDAVLSPSTINAYKSYRRTRFNAYMSEDVEQINYQRMINEECKKVSPKTVHNAFRLVTASLKHEGITIPEVNLPQKHKTERPWLDYQQIQILLDKCKGKPYELGILLGLHGLRRSEMLHLTSDDVDTDKGLIFVRGASVIGTGNKLVSKETNKTTASSRVVNIVIPRLNELIDGKEGKLITTNPTTLYGSINDICRQNSLPTVGVHGLRHSFASLAYHLGWSELTTMREGGWSNPDTVHRIYTHLAAQDANEDIQKMKDFYS